MCASEKNVFLIEQAVGWCFSSYGTFYDLFSRFVLLRDCCTIAKKGKIWGNFGCFIYHPFGEKISKMKQKVTTRFLLVITSKCPQVVSAAALTDHDDYTSTENIIWSCSFLCVVD